jgi:PAS domain S-box-containing protein
MSMALANLDFHRSFLIVILPPSSCLPGVSLVPAFVPGTRKETPVLVEKRAGAAHRKVGNTTRREDLLESGADYRAVFDALGDAVFVIDTGTAAIRQVNRKMCEMYGYSAKEAVRMRWGDMSGGFSPYTDEDANRRIAKAAEIGPQLFEWPTKDKSGRLFWVEVSARFAAIGQCSVIVATARDITDRKRVERELTTTKDYLHTVFNSIHDALFVHDVHGRVTDVNETMLSMYQLSRDEALGLSIVPDYTMPEGLPDLPAIWKRVLAGEHVFHEAKGRRPKDGYEFDVEVFLTQLPLLEGDHILAIVHDISGRKRVERELIATKNYLDTVFNNIHDAVFVNDLNGKVIDVNEPMLDMYGVTKAEALSYSIVPDYTTPEGRPDFPAIWKRVLAGEHVFHQAKGRRPKDGYEFDVEVFLTQLRVPEGDYILATVRDVSQRKLIERQLIREKETFFSVLEDNPHGIALMDHDDRCTYVNPEFTKITGFGIEDVPTWDAWIQKDQGPKPSTRTGGGPEGRSPRGQRGDRTESRIRCKNGQHKDVEFRITNLQDRRLLVLTDVTARNRAEEGLRAEKQKFQTLAESSPVGMVVIVGGDAFKFKYVNPKFRELFDGNAKDACDMHEWLERAYPNPTSRRKAARKWIATLKATRPGIDKSFARKLTTGDGSHKHVRFVLVRLEEGEILMTCWDITKNKEAEQEIRERSLALEILNDVMASVTGSLRLSEILAALRRVFTEKLKIGGGGIFFPSETDSKISTEICWGVPPSDRNGLAAFVLKCFREGVVVHENEITLVRYRPGGRDSEIASVLRQRGWHGYLCLSLLSQGEAQGMIFLADTKRDAFSDDRMPFYRTLGQQIGVALQNARLFEQVRKSHVEMRDLSVRLVRAQENQLRYVARELHDEIGQLLTGLGLALQMAAQRSSTQETSLAEAQSLASTITGLVRELSRNLRPPMLDDLGLLPTLPWLFERFFTRTNVRVDFEHTEVDNMRFSHEVETAVYRIVQEALTNVARHAMIDRVTVRLWSGKKTLGVQIEDRGIGFDFHSTTRARKTNGLDGMRERAALLGGRFTVESSIGNGTRLTAELPTNAEGVRP